MTVTSLVAATSLRALPRKSLSRLMGRLARVEAPDPVLATLIRLYCRAYGVDLSECEIPREGFTSFDAFFTRRLKPGARVIDANPNTIVSPADGRVDDWGVIESGAVFRVKGRAYDVAELLGDQTAGSEMVGGLFAVVYLSPRDYHRVHAPVSGQVSAVRHVAGTLFPVNAIGVAHFPKLLARNERVVVHQRSAEHGHVVTVMVGAVGVGRISLGFDDSVITNDGPSSGLRVYGEDPPTLERGEELGVFHLGSTVVLLMAPGAPRSFVPAPGDHVRMGSALVRAPLAEGSS